MLKSLICKFTHFAKLMIVDEENIVQLLPEALQKKSIINTFSHIKDM